MRPDPNDPADNDGPGPGIRSYPIGDGWEAWVGRTDADNDHLSIKLARPDDYWFHVRGMPGSHVLLRARAGMTPGRYVTKPRGAKPGTVQIRKETVLKVRPALPGTPPIP